jgi:vitamin B12 transporter
MSLQSASSLHISLRFNKSRHVAPWLVAAGAAAGPAPAPAAPDPASDEVLVTATRAHDGIETRLLGSSYTILTALDLETRQVRVLADVLRDVPGISVNRAGAVGGQTQVRLRGGESNHTLVLIDGIEAGDPFNGEFPFESLLADDLARVEVLRGQQSALYGSDAIGGVIHYLTPTGAQAPGLRARVEGGSFGTLDGAVHWGGVAGNLDYSLSGSYFGTDGVATALNGSRDVGDWTQTYGTKLTWSPLENLRVRVAGRYVQARAQSNDQDFNFPPGPSYGQLVDTDSYYTQQNAYGLVRTELELLDGRWSQALSVQGVDGTHRDYSYAFGGSFFTAGSRSKFSYESTLRFGGERVRQAVTFALDRKHERYLNVPIFAPGPQNERRKLDNTGVVAEYELQYAERLGFGAALRHDDNSRFDDATTYRVQTSYRVTNALRLRAAAGTGVKNPTNFELFGFDPTSFLGNPGLTPEKSTGWEVGADLALPEQRATVALTHFDSRFTDEIYTAFLPGFVSSPGNRSTVSTQTGVELSVAAHLAAAWQIDASWTWLDAKENALEEIRRPKQSGSLNLAWRGVADALGLALTVRHNGATQDTHFGTNARVALDAYTVVNLGGDWKLSERLGLFARIDNLLDEDYQEIFSYRSVGRGAYAGVKLQF